jgi:hypothetical protein
MPLPEHRRSLNHVVIHAVKTDAGWVMELTSNVPGADSNRPNEVHHMATLDRQLLDDNAELGDVVFFVAMSLSSWSQQPLVD